MTRRAHVPTPPGLSPLEVAAGMPLGLEEAGSYPETALAPFAALEAAVAGAVRRPPCYVAFSGGHDSSLVLAAAVRVAAREDASPPVAITLRFPGHERAWEDDWQEFVLDHLGLSDRVVVEVNGDLDLVGSAARAELRRRGVLYPANAHSLAPLVEAAAEGTLLVGLGGDELFGGHRWTRLNDALARRRRPVPRDAVRAAVAALPGQVEGRLLVGRLGTPPAWLRPAAVRSLRRALREEANEPVRFDCAVRRAARVRTPVVARRSLESLGGASTRVEAPLLAPEFVSALARAGGARGFGDRAAVMRAVATGVLPDSLLERRAKAHFGTVFFGQATRDFAESWSGEGVDESLVDRDALRREWLRASPDFRSAVLLQVAWLHDRGTGLGRDAESAADG
jgi:asparagine synthetase B (glutamine-hydrolysing)